MADSTEPMKFKDREARIRKKAFDLWEKEGRPEGQAQDHWHRAAKDIDQEGEGFGVDRSTEDSKTPSVDKALADTEVHREDGARAKPSVLRQR